MQILFGLILISGVLCNVLRQYPHHAQQVLSKDLSDIVDTYVAFSDDMNDKNRLDIFSQIQRTYLNKLHAKMLQDSQVTEPENYEQTAYLLVKTMRQRDKRYISYLTLCHFKICNMGRKRTTRYFHMIRTLDDKDE